MNLKNGKRKLKDQWGNDREEYGDYNGERWFSKWCEGSKGFK